MRSQRRLVTLVGACQTLQSSPSHPPYVRPVGHLVASFFSIRTKYLIVDPVIEMKFETGDEKLKDLETGVFIGAGRFVIEKGKPIVVEYKISKAVKGD